VGVLKRLVRRLLADVRRLALSAGEARGEARGEDLSWP
jgi:hypothetical protein